MPAPSVTYTLTNGTTADATQVQQNFTDLVNAMSDGTKDFSINAITAAGTATFNGNVTLGNASGDDVTFTGSLASTIPIKTNNSFNIGSATLGLAGLYLGTAGLGATARVVAASHASGRTYTGPDAGATATFLMSEGAKTINGACTFATAPTLITGRTDGSLPGSGYLGEVIYGPSNKAVGAMVSFTSSGAWKNFQTISLTAGNWLVIVQFQLQPGSNTTVFDLNTSTDFNISAATASGTGANGNNAGIDYNSIWIDNATNEQGKVASASIVTFLSPTSTTTYYVNANCTYTGTAPKARAGIQAFRLP